MITNEYDHIAASAYLEQAAGIIAKGWIQGNDALNTYGGAVDPNSPGAVARCLRGAVIATGATDAVRRQVWRALASVCGMEPVTYNDADGRKQEHVVDACRKAAKLIARGPIEARPARTASRSCPCAACREASDVEAGRVTYNEGTGAYCVPRAPKALRARVRVDRQAKIDAEKKWAEEVEAQKKEAKVALAKLQAMAAQMKAANTASAVKTFSQPFDFSKLLNVPAKAEKVLEPAF